MQTGGMKVRARYRTVGPRKVKQKYNHCWMDKETNSLQQEVREQEVDMFTVFFPQGHSIRVTYPELKRLGYHIKPRMVDMNTGDVVDFGGDEYDFGDGTTDADEDEDIKSDGEDLIIEGATRNKGK